MFNQIKQKCILIKMFNQNTFLFLEKLLKKLHFRYYVLMLTGLHIR